MTQVDQSIPSFDTATGLSTTQRVMNLQSSGYGFLPLQTLFALTNAGLSDQEIRSQADALRQATLAGDQANAFAKQAKDVRSTEARAETLRVQQNGAISIEEARRQIRAQNTRQFGGDPKKVLQRADDGFKVFWADPVLQKAPSAALALKQYVSGAVGPWPINENDLAHTQQQMQLRGFGRGLPVNGVWGPEWQSAQTEYVNSLYNRQLAGDKPGSVTLGHAMQALNALMPTSAFDALVGFVVNAPRDLFIHAAAGFAAGGSFLYNAPTQGLQGGVNQAARDQANVIASAESAVGNPTTRKQVLERSPTQIAAQFVQDVSTVLTLTSAMGAGGRLARAIGEVPAAATAAEAETAGGVIADTVGGLRRGPGTLMRTFVGENAVDPVTGAVVPGMVAKPLGRAVAGAALGGVGTGLATGGDEKATFAGAALGGLAGFLSTTNAFNNGPAMMKLGPVLDGLADEQGLYYKARSIVAAPYKYKAVQVAGEALQEASVLGAKIRGLAAAQGAVGLGTDTTQAIQDEHTIDSVNDSIKHRLDFTILGAHIQPSLDDLQFFLHGFPTQTRAATGAAVDHVKAAVDQALSEPGFAAAIQRNTGMTAEKAIRAIQKDYPEFTEDQWQRFWRDKVADHAAWFGALDRRNRELQTAGQAAEEAITTDRWAAIKQYQHEIRNDPEKLADAVRGMAGQKDQLFEQLHHEIAMSGTSPTKFMRNNIAEFMAANDHARDTILPFVGERISGSPAGDLLRWDQPGLTAEAANKPHGLYLTSGVEDASQSPHAFLGEEEGAVPHRFQSAAKNPLEVPDIRLPSTDRAMYPGQEIPVSAGISALHKLVGPEEYVRINELSRPALEAEIKARWPNVDVAQYGDRHELMEAYGAHLAREAGHDAITLQEEVGNFGPMGHSEYVALHPSAIRSAEGGVGHEGNRVLLGASDKPGGFGIAKTSTLVREDGLDLANQWQAKAEDLFTRERADRAAGVTTGPAVDARAQAAELPGVMPEEHNALESEIANALHFEFGVTASKMPHDLQGKIDAFRNFSEGLATRVKVHPDAPASLKRAVAKLEEMGYQPVAGTDIGHRMVDGNGMIDVFHGPLTLRRRIIENLGLDPAMVEGRQIYPQATDNFITNLQEAIDKNPNVRLAPFETPATIWADLQRKGVIDNPGGGIRGALQKLARTPERFAKSEGWFTETGAPDVVRAEAEMNSHISPQNITFKQIQSALTDTNLGARHPASMTEFQARADALAAQGLEVPPIYNEATQRAVLAAVRKAYAQLPARYLGAEKLTNLFRDSMSFAGGGRPQRAIAGAVLGATGAYLANPDDPNWERELAGAAAGGLAGAAVNDHLGYAMANLPNALIKARNDFRFDLDPAFNFRRVAKANVKMAAEGVPMTWNPLESMKRAGTLAYDRKVYDRVAMGTADAMATADDAVLAAAQQGIYGFNPRNFEAYIAGHLARKGLSDDEVKAGIIKMMEYGTGTMRGRSPLERTVNFMFFPFSFDKTLYRNLGGYLLDKPAQRILLTRGMAAYDDFNKNNMDGSNPLATSFWTKHAPLAKEVVTLNAFAHGVGVGEPGGINRPLLNLFLPQAWSSSKDNLATLKRFIPMVKEFSNIWDESQQQVSITGAMVSNLWHDLKGIPAIGPVFGKKAGYTVSSPPKSTLSTQAQMDAGFAMQRQVFATYAQVLDFNSKSSNVDKIKFPVGAEWGDYAGQPITKTTIRTIIHGYYPAFTVNGAVIAATDHSVEWNSYLRHVQATDKAHGGEVATFADNVTKLAKVLNSSSLPAADAAHLTTLLRQQAAALAEKDADFYKLYNSNFSKSLGPLERVM